MARTVQVRREQSSAAQDYDVFHALAVAAGKEKAFLAKFGTKKQFLEKCRVTEA